MNTETVNGTQVTLWQWMPEACPMQTVGHSEHLARTSALQESEKGLTAIDQVLYEKFLDSWKKCKKKINLNGLSMKMLRECFLQTKDSTICKSSLKWTDLGTIYNGRICTQNGTYRSTGSAYTLLDTNGALEQEIFYL